MPWIVGRACRPRRRARSTLPVTREVAAHAQLTTLRHAAVQLERAVGLDVARPVVEVAVEAGRRGDVDATGSDAREAVDRRDEPRAVGAHDDVVADLDGRGASARAPGRARPARCSRARRRRADALDRQHGAGGHRPEAAALHGSELGRERQLAVLGLDRPGAPRDLLGERDAGEAARDGVIAHAVHDAPRSEERVHASRRRAPGTGCARSAGGGATSSRFGG